MIQFNDNLDISVIIATHNRDRSLDRTLETITQIHYGNLKVEFIVVDNNSSDRTKEVVESYANRLNIRYLFESRQGKNRALNQALHQVPLGKLVVFADDDIIPDRLWLFGLLEAARRWPDDCIFGSTILPKFPDRTPDWIADPYFSYGTVAYSRYYPRKEEGYVNIAPFGCSFAVRREIFQSFSFNDLVGPNTSKKYIMGSETEFLNRLQQAGYRFIYAKNSRVEHIIRPEQIEVNWLLARAYKYGKSRAFLHPPTGNKSVVLIKLLVKTSIAWFLYIFSLFLADPIKFKAGEKFYFFQGHLFQLSQMYWENVISQFTKNPDIETKEVASEF
jgi:hypothetical protein